MSWAITFYNEKVEEETLSFPAGILANFLRISEMIEELGPNLGLPYTRAMGDACSRYAPKAAKALAGVIQDQEVVVLSSFIKKSRQTLKKNWIRRASE